MKWENNRESDQIEDRRSDGPSGLGGVGGMLGGGRGGRGMGLGAVVVALVLGWALGINPLTILGVMSGGGGSLPPSPSSSAPAHVATGQPGDEMGRFVASVLGGTEDAWGAIFQQAGAQYTKPRLVLFRGRTPTACGQGDAAMGPFYCPGDQKVYIDLAFYDTLRQQLGAPGDFAQAYVIAHEVGHHVQKLMGTSDKMAELRQRVSEREYNAMSVRLELQADCFAGIWAHHNQRSAAILESGDVEEALNAASAIGDDTLQRSSRGTVVPDSFTHGTSEQRQHWFARGLETGRVQDCDTFKARRL